MVLERTLYDGGVDFVLNGHVHAYERSRAVFDWKNDVCGPTHLVVGDGGNYEGPYGDGWRAPQPDWSAFREGSFGAGRLVIENATDARWTWHRTTCVESGGHALQRDLVRARGRVERERHERHRRRGGTLPQLQRRLGAGHGPGGLRALQARPGALSEPRRLGRSARRRLGVARVLARRARDGGDARKADAFFEAFLGAGWAATAAALAWALAALRRERRGAGAFGTRAAPARGRRRYPVREICRRGFEKSDLRRASRRGALVVSNASSLYLVRFFTQTFT